MADTAVVPCPHCDEKCAVASQHLNRRLACPHCQEEFVPAGGGGGARRGGGGGGRGGGGGGGGGGGRSGGGGRPRSSSGNPMVVVGGVGALLLLIVGVAVMGGKRGSRTGRSRSDSGESSSQSVTTVRETAARDDQPARSRDDGPVDPVASINLSKPESGNYAVNGTIYNSTVSVRLWKDPHKLSEGRKAGLVAHQDSVEALGVGTNNRGIKVYRVRGKSKLGGRTIEGFVSAFYIEKDHKAVAEHKWEWVDPDDWERHGVSPEDHD